MGLPWSSLSGTWRLGFALLQLSLAPSRSKGASASSTSSSHSRGSDYPDARAVGFCWCAGLDCCAAVAVGLLKCTSVGSSDVCRMHSNRGGPWVRPTARGGTWSDQRHRRRGCASGDGRRSSARPEGLLSLLSALMCMRCGVGTLVDGWVGDQAGLLPEVGGHLPGGGAGHPSSRGLVLHLESWCAGAKVPRRTCSLRATPLATLARPRRGREAVGGGAGPLLPHLPHLVPCSSLRLWWRLVHHWCAADDCCTGTPSRILRLGARLS